MTLIDNAGTVATKAWSVRLAALTAFLSLLQPALPYIISALNTGSMPDLVQAIIPLLSGVLPADTLSLLTSAAALATIIARFVAQPAMAAAIQAAASTPKE